MNLIITETLPRLNFYDAWVGTATSKLVPTPALPPPATHFCEVTLKAAPSPALPSCPTLTIGRRADGHLYLVLFLQFDGLLGGLLLLHPQLLVPVLQQVKEGGGRPVGKKSRQA